jgi:enhancing lycopene biosynthesis protein 2
MTKKIAIVLAGSGAKDGSEIHEAVCTLLALDQQGASVQCFAPDIRQAHVVNHITDEDMPEERNVLIEAARICRGDIKPLSAYNPADFDALIFPGGFGAAKNLFTLAFDGPDFAINEDVERAVLSTHAAKKPMGALCISPALLAKLIPGARVTLGQDTNTANALGAQHEITTHGEITIDEDNKLVTTPCYMLDASIKDIAAGASNLVKAVLERT